MRSGRTGVRSVPVLLRKSSIKYKNMKVIMNVAGVFQIEGLGLVVTGHLSEDVSVGANVQIQRKDGSVISSKIVDIRSYNTSMPSASAGTDIALVLAGVNRSNVGEGDLIGFGTETVSHNSFLMRIDDKFLIKGRGVVVTGVVAAGTVVTGDTVRLMRQSTSSIKLIVGGIEHKGTLVDNAKPGENVGIFFEGFDFNMVEIGDVLIG